MKIHLIIIATLILVSTLVYMVLEHEGDREPESEADTVHSSQTVDELMDGTGGMQDTALQTAEVKDDNHRKEMQEAYSQLQQSRQQLKSRANLLKSRIWGLELPPEQARSVSKKMRGVYAYLKNPPMLGAYFDVHEIMIDIRKVKAMQAGLQEVEHLISTPKVPGQ